MDQPAAQTPDQSRSPSSLPGRDPTADADTSLIRKRARLSHEQESPPAINDDSSNSATLSDLQGDSAHSPTVVEIPQISSNDPPGVSIIMSDVEILDFEHIDAFPFRSDQFPTPELAAEALAHLFRLPNEPVEDKDLVKFHDWLDKHIDATENKFKASLEGGSTSDASDFYHVYSDNPKFWNHVVACFGHFGLRSGFNQRSEYYGEVGSFFFQSLLDLFVRLGERLLKTELVILDQVNARRDSTRPVETPKHTLMFTDWLTAFHALITRERGFLRRSSLSLKLDSKSIRSHIILRFQGCAMVILVDLLARIVAKPGAIKSPFIAVQVLLWVCREVFVAISDIGDNLLEGLFKQTLRLYKVVETIALESLPKIHPDDLPPQFHTEIGVMQTEVLHLLLGTKHLSPSSAYEMIMKQVADYQTDPADMIARSPGERQTSSNNNGDESSIKDTLMPDMAYSCVNADKLEYYNALGQSNIAELRVLGIDHFGRLVHDLWSTHLPALNEYLSRLIHAKGIMPYIFGPQSHAAVISRSYNVVGFLATTRTMTRSDADALWSTFIKYQQSDISQHAGIILYQAVTNMNSTQLMYFCRKYSNLDSSQFTRQAERMMDTLLAQLPKSIGFNNSDCFNAACVCINMLGTVGAPGGLAATQDFQIHSLKRMLQALPSPIHVQEQLQLVDMCVGPIKSHSDLATGCIQALFCILRLQKQPIVPTLEIVSRLSLQDCTEELIHFVQSAKRSNEEVAANALICRIDLIFHILAISDPATTVATEKLIWNYVVGENSISAETREIAWTAMTSNLERLRVRVSGFYQRCISQFLPSLSPDLVTPGTCALFSLEDKRQASHPEILMPLKEDLLRFAVLCPSNQISMHLITVIINQLFDGKAFAVPSVAVTEQIDMVRKCVEMLSLRDISSSRAANLLRFAITCSIRYESNLEPTKKVTSDQSGSAPVTQPEPDKMQIPIRIHQGNADPQNHVLTVNKSASCSELNAAITSEIGSENYTAISSGQKMNFTSEPQQLIQKLGLKEGKTLIVQKHSTLESIGEDALKGNGRTAVEEELISHLDALYAAVDELSITGEYAYHVLEYLRFPGPIRSLVTSPDTPFDVIFPSAKPWKMRLSIEVISKQLQEQIAVGLADEKFLLRGVHLLIDLLDRDGCIQTFPVVQRASEVLLALLRERPVKDDPEAYFQDPKRFASRTLSMLSQLHQQTTSLDKPDPRAHVIHTLYLCLLESVLLSSSLRAAFAQANEVVAVHQTLLLTANGYLSHVIPASIVAAIHDDRMSSHTKDFFWSMFLERLIPATQEQPSLCKGVYDLGYEILTAKQELNEDGPMLRTLVDHFANHLLDLQHLESQGSNFVDHRVQGLTGLTRYCVESLKRLKKPLNLGTVAPKLFNKFLFPPTNVFINKLGEDSPQPVITTTTRKALYQLVRAMCDDFQVLMELSNLCKNVGSIDLSNDWNFPGPEHFVRSNCSYAGLENLAQTCYMNSLLQQLFMNINFRKFILDTPIVDQKSQSILYEFKMAFAQMQNSQGPTFCPEALAKALNVDVTVQDDAHIFFTTLIGKLEDSMPDEDAKKSLKAFFGGVNKSQTTGSCKHVSESHDEYFNLSLVVKDKASLAESLDEYTQGAALEGGDKFKCTTCGSGDGTYVDAVRRTALEHIPDNLVLGLKRFRYETYDGGTKVNDRFEFPERIDMSPYKLQRLAGVNDQDEPDFFQLVGVVVHSGTLAFGHYWSYAAERGCTGPGPVPWFRLEDSTVTRSSIEKVINETSGGPLEKSASGQGGQSPVLRADNAYLLFYQRVTSLEDSVKCLVSDSTPSAASTHPKVDLPPDIAANIACGNAKHMHLLNLFSVDHLNFVLDLAARLEDLKDSAPSHTMAAEDNILGLLFVYLVTVFSRSPAANLIEHAALMTQKLACSRPRYAGEILDSLFADTPEARYKREHLIFNKKAVVRKTTSRLVLGCLEYLRKVAPDMYITPGDVSMPDLLSTTRVGQVAHGLDHMLEMLPDNKNAWIDYFDLIGQMADIGLRETDIMLSLGLLQCCIDIVVIHLDPNLQRQNSTLWYHMQNNRKYPMGAVIDCIYMLLHKYVDLRASPLRSVQIGESRKTNASTLLLSSTELSGLAWRNDSGEGHFMMACIQNSMRPKSESLNDWKICKLAVLLTNVDKTAMAIVIAAYNAILNLIQSCPGVHAEVLACVLLAQILDGQATATILETMVARLHVNRLRELPEVATAYTRILNIVYGLLSPLILQYLAPLVEGLVMCECDEAERETARWLKDQVLVQESLSRPYTLRSIRLYHQRFSAVKRLTYDLEELLKGPAQSGYDVNLYEAAIKCFRDCGAFLTVVIDSVREDMDGWLSKERRGLSPECERAMDEMIEEVVDELSVNSDLMIFIEGGNQMIDEWANEDSNRLAFRQNRGGRSDAEEETDADVVESEDEELEREFDDTSNV